MSKQQSDSMTELLRTLLEGESLTAVQRATGLKRQALTKFRRREQSLRLDMADRLAKHYGIVCRVERQEAKGR